MLIRKPTDPPAISYSQYLALVRRFDRNELIKLAAVVSSRNHGVFLTDTGPSPFLPWNVAGLAITAICRGYVGGSIPTLSDLALLSWQFGNIWDEPQGDDQLAAIRFFEQLTHEQIPFQQSMFNEWARSQALFDNTPFPSGRSPEVMNPGWVQELLKGVSLAEYSGAGFVFWSSAIVNSGIYNPTIWDSSLDALLAIFPRERIEEIGRLHFTASIEELKQLRRAVVPQNLRSEKHMFNPLIARPFVVDVLENSWVAPSSDLLGMKLTTAGIVHEGLQRWGEAFTRDLGLLFESYVGQHLRLPLGGVVLPEIEYGPRKARKRSADWILVLSSSVVIVEVKATSPTENMRQGAGEAFIDIRRKLAKAVRQTAETVNAIDSDRVAFEGVPTHLPRLALVVTLGNFPTAEMAFHLGELGASKVPIAFVSAGDLELLMAMDQRDLEAVVSFAIGSAGANNLVEFNVVRSRIEAKTNPITEHAWSANPVMSFIQSRRTARPAIESQHAARLRSLGR